MKVLVTGVAGFIGFHTALALLRRGNQLVGIDNINDYYDVNIKLSRLKILEEEASRLATQFDFCKINIADRDAVSACFSAHKPTHVINLAAQAGIRYSLENPVLYAESNLMGFTHILEGCRQNAVEHLTYASTSSVYGANTTLPFSEEHSADHPLQFYAATKRANELMAHAYSHLYRLPTTGLRFFTVYGPWGRPDMALYSFTKSMLAGDPIDVFNYGKHIRDFTYIDDIVEAVIRINDQAAQLDPNWDSKTPRPQSSNAPYRILNIGNNQPVPLNRYITALEHSLGVKAKKNLLPLQDGDLLDTYANVDNLNQAIGFSPKTSIETGVQKFVDWYRDYHQVNN